MVRIDATTSTAAAAAATSGGGGDGGAATDGGDGDGGAAAGNAAANVNKSSGKAKDDETHHEDWEDGGGSLDTRVAGEYGGHAKLLAECHGVAANIYVAYSTTYQQPAAKLSVVFALPLLPHPRPRRTP